MEGWRRGSVISKRRSSEVRRTGGETDEGMPKRFGLSAAVKQSTQERRREDGWGGKVGERIHRDCMQTGGDRRGGV